MNNFISAMHLMSGNEPIVADWIVKSFPIIKVVLAVLIFICALFMIIAVLCQKSEADGTNAITGQADTFYNRNKGESLQGKIKKLMIIDAILLLVFCVAFVIINAVYSGGF